MFALAVNVDVLKFCSLIIIAAAFLPLARFEERAYANVIVTD